MKLKNKDIQYLLETAIDAALSAGQYISSQIQNHHEIKIKNDTSSLASQVVTAIDLESQKLIIHHLKKSIRKYDLALLSEEESDDGSRFEKEYFWCIDPLDGTLCFTEQRHGFAVSIALVSNEGQSILGVIYDPNKKNLYYASLNNGAFFNHKSWSVLINQNPKTFTLNIDRSFTKHKNYSKYISQLKTLSQEEGIPNFRINQFGGAVMNTIWTMKSPPAVYFKLPKKNQGGGSIWDFAAAACIIQEAGGNATDIYGHPIDLNKKGSSYMNHRGILFANNEVWSHRMISLINELENS